MAKGKSGLSLGEYAILGILRERPMHGYDVTRHFGPDRDLALVAPMEMSNIYAMLKDLQEQGLIEGQREVVGLRPPRTVFRLTREAEEQFHAWLEEPVGRMREVRSDLLVKLYFCRMISPAITRRLLDAQIGASSAYLERLTHMAAEVTPESFERLVYGSKIGAAQAAVGWLQEERVRLDG
jgi:DNA-binding PadR family transcriptional regulator